MVISRNTPILAQSLEKAAIFLLLFSLLAASPCIGAGPPPVITIQPTNKTAQLLDSVAFSVTASSGKTMSYQWNFNGNALSGATSSSYTISRVQATNAGTYRVKISNAGGSVTSSKATLTVLIPPAITTQPQSQTAMLGGNVSFSVVASGTAPLGYQWSFNGTALAGATSSTLTLNNVQMNSAGSYSVVVTNAVGSASSTNATLTVSPGVMTMAASSITTNTAKLNAVVNAQVLGPQFGYVTYYWQFGLTTNYSSSSGNTIIAASTNGVAVTINTTSIANLTPGTWYHFNIVGTGVNGTSVGADMTFMTPFMPPAVTTLAANNITTNSATLNATVNPQGTTASYYFQYGLTTNYTAFIATNSLVAGTNAVAANAIITGLALGTPYHYCVVAVSSGGTSVGGDATFTTTCLPPAVTILAANNITPSSATLNATVNPQGTTANYYFQYGLTTNYTAFSATNSLAAGTNAVATNASITGLVSGTLYHYCVVAGSSGGTSISSDATFTTTYLPPAITTQPQSQARIAGQNAALSVTASGIAPLNYQWQATNAASGGFTNLANAGQISGANTNVLVIANVLTNDALFYRVIITNIIGAVTSSPASLTVYPNTLLIDGDIGSGATQTGAAVLGSLGDVWNTITNASSSLVNSAGTPLGGIGFTLNNSAQLYLAANGTPADLGTTNLMGDYAFGYTNSGYTPSITTSITGLTLYTNSAFVLVVYQAGNQVGQGGILALNGATGGNTTSSLTNTAASRMISAGAGVAYNIFQGILTNGTLTVTSTRLPGNAFTIMNGFQLELSTLPIITAQPASQTNANGKTVSFTVGALGAGTLSYQWNVNGSNVMNGPAISGATNATLTLSNVQPAQAGNVFVVITNNAGSITSSVATLTVYVPPTITTSPASQALILGQSATFTVAASGTSPLSYKWNFNGANIVGGTNVSLTVTNIQTTNAGNYAVVVTNIAGSVTSAVAVLTVYVPPAITNQPASRALILGQNATFTVGASGTAPLNYLWSLNGTNIFSSTNTTFTATNIDSTDAGSYTVVVTNLAGSATSAVATLTITVPVAGSYFEAVVTNNPIAYWRLDELSGTTAFDCIGGNNATYNNVTLNQPSALATDSNPSAAFNGTSAYAGTDVGLANNLAAFTFEGWFKLTTATARMGLFGQNDVIELGFDTKTTLQVYTEGGGSVTVTNTWSTNSWHHIAAVGNGTNIFLYVDGSLAGTGGTTTNNYGSSTYLFNIGGGGVFDPTTNWFNGGLDEVAVYGHALAATDVKRHYLLGLALPTISLTAPTNNAAFAAPATINLAANVVTNGHTISQVQFFNGATLLNQDLTAPYTYSWSGVGAGTNNISAVAIYDTGSVTSSVVTVTVLTPPSITTQPQSLAVITGQSAVFSVAASGASPLAYQWQFNGTNLASATNTSLTIANVQTNNAGNYSVVVTNLAGSATSTVAALTVYVPPTITSQPASQALIQGQNATFTVGDSGTAPLNYAWSFNGTNIAYGTNSSLTVTNIAPANAGSYSVLVTNLGGSATSSVATLTVYLPTIITTQPQDVGVAQGQTASLSVAASGSSPLSYQWYFDSASLGGSGQSATLALNNISPDKAGSYWAVVTGAGGSVTSAVAVVTVYVLPGIQTQPQNQTVLQGQTATFSVVTNNNGTPPFYYQWNVNGTNTTDDGQFVFGSTNATLTLSNVQPAQAGNVFVVITNLAGSITSSVVTLTVNVPAFITNQPVSQALIQGQSTTLSVGAGGTENLSYQWYLNGTSLNDNSQKSTLSLNNVTTDNAGSYTVVVNNNYGAVTSAVATLTVYVPPTITNQPQNQTLAIGQTAVFSVGACSPAPPGYQWCFNGTNLVDATNASLTLTGVQTTNAGNYTVVVTNCAGWVMSAAATLTVTNPVITLSAGAGSSPSLTSGGFSFQVSIPVGVTYVILTSTDFVYWTPLVTNVAVNASEMIVDPSATNYPVRYYRVVSQ